MGKTSDRRRPKRDRQFNLRVSAHEYELIRRAAGQYPPTTWARVQILEAAERELRKGGKKR